MPPNSFKSRLSWRYAVSSSSSRSRSSPAADGVALTCAAGLLVATLFFHGAELLHNQLHLYVTLATTLGFALAARLARGVSTSGALAGAIVAFVLASRDFKMFIVLLVVFCVTLAATRFGRSRKQQLQLAETASGRSASQVMANLGVAGLILALPFSSSSYLLALAALAEVVADTTSSEIGTAFSSRIVLITNLKTVPAGTDGGVSLTGTVAGILGGIISAASATFLGLVGWPETILIAAAAVIGMLLDSVLGATLERRGYLNNDFVNLLSTAAAAGFAWILK